MLYHQIPAWQFNLQGAEAAVEVVETRGENELFIHSSQRLRGKNINLNDNNQERLHKLYLHHLPLLLCVMRL